MAAQEGARLVVLDFPVGMSFGIDAMTYTTGKRFRGVGGIPPGIHFAHWGLGGSAEEGASTAAGSGGGIVGRHGFFFAATHPADVIVWRWD